MRKFKLRNGEIVNEAPNHSTQQTVAVVHQGVLQHLLRPSNPGLIDSFPTGGVLGTAFDVIAWEENFDPFSDDIHSPLLHAAGNNELGVIDTMSNKDAFVTIEYYHGTPVAQLSDDQVFSYVRNIDAKLKELGGLGDGKAVTAHRVRLETEKEGLLRVVDSRYDADADTSE